MSNNKGEQTPEQILRRVNKILEGIEEAKADKQQSIGRREELFAQMKRSYGIATIDQAEKRIKALDEQITRRNKSVVTLFEKLEEEYDF